MFHRSRTPSEKGQDIVEFTILVTFFLIVFFTTLQVSWTAIGKFQLNHYALQCARMWSSGPADLGAPLPPTMALLELNEAEGRKKGAPLNAGFSLGDSIRRGGNGFKFSMIGSGSTWVAGTPRWTTSVNAYVTGPGSSELTRGDGLVFTTPISIIMPYASLIMGGKRPPLPYKVIDSWVFIPMAKEPSELVDPVDSSRSQEEVIDDFDNNGIDWWQFGASPDWNSRKLYSPSSGDPLSNYFSMRFPSFHGAPFFPGDP